MTLVVLDVVLCWSVIAGSLGLVDLLEQVVDDSSLLGRDTGVNCVGALLVLFDVRFGQGITWIRKQLQILRCLWRRQNIRDLIHPRGNLISLLLLELFLKSRLLLIILGVVLLVRGDVVNVVHFSLRDG